MVRTEENLNAYRIACKKGGARMVLANNSAHRPGSDCNVLFCAIGLLITLIVMLSFPDFGALIEQYNQF
jgi:hypothetical protein